MIKITVLNIQYKYYLTFIASSASGRVLLTAFGKHLQHDFQIHPKEKLLISSQF